MTSSIFKSQRRIRIRQMLTRGHWSLDNLEEQVRELCKAYQVNGEEYQQSFNSLLGELGWACQAVKTQCEKQLHEVEQSMVECIPKPVEVDLCWKWTWWVHFPGPHSSLWWIISKWVELFLHHLPSSRSSLLHTTHRLTSWKGQTKH